MEDNKDTEKVDNKEAETSKEETQKEETTKTYTQEDIDNSFNAGVKKAKSDWQKDEKYKEFLEWKKSNQNESDKINELTSLNEQLAKENKLLKATNEVAKSDVKPEFLKFVTSEVLGLVDEDTDFDTALKNYKKENTQFFGEVVVRKTQSSPTLNGGKSQETTANSIMNDILRNARN